MPPQPVLERQEPVQNLGRFGRSLAEALGTSAPAPDPLQSALCAAVSAECVQCGIRITGGDLIELSKPANDAPSDPRIARLRQGYCARNDCNSYYYRLTFAPHPDLDWSQLLSRIDSRNEAQPQPTAVENDITTAAPARERRRLLARLFLALTVVAVLFLLRQWYRGGRIPWIREPENFQVDRLQTDLRVPE